MIELDYAMMCERVAERCAGAGFDIVWPLQVGWYNDAVDEAYRVPDFGDAATLAVVIGNTRALWPVFCQALERDDALGAEKDPLDRYTERALGAAVAQVGESHAYELRFSHEPPPRRVAMQRLAHVSGLAHLSPSYLSVHPTYGPWLALRALVVIAGVRGPEARAEPPSPCGCEAYCMPFFRHALARSAGITSAGVRSSWRDWLAVRDACPVGRDHRYSDAQIRYHYIKDKTVLPDGK